MSAVNYNQLGQATGSSSRVYNITNLGQLDGELTQICQDIGSCFLHLKTFPDQNIASSNTFPNDIVSVDQKLTCSSRHKLPLSRHTSLGSAGRI